MGKDDKRCPKCGEEMVYRLGAYECPSCFFEERGAKEAPPISASYRTSSSQLEETLRGKPHDRELGDPELFRRR